MTEHAGPGTKPWRIQIVIRGRAHHLGCSHSEVEGARIYDNAAYHLGLRGFKYRRLNFPEEYADPSKAPPPTKATLRALLVYLSEPSGPEYRAKQKARIASLRKLVEQVRATLFQAIAELAAFDAEGMDGVWRFRKEQQQHQRAAQLAAEVVETVADLEPEPEHFDHSEPESVEGLTIVEED